MGTCKGSTQTSASDLVQGQPYLQLVISEMVQQDANIEKTLQWAAAPQAHPSGEANEHACFYLWLTEGTKYWGAR